MIIKISHCCRRLQPRYLSVSMPSLSTFNSEHQHHKPTTAKSKQQTTTPQYQPSENRFQQHVTSTDLPNRMSASADYDQAFARRTAPYCKNRRMLFAQNIKWGAKQDEFEKACREKLTAPALPDEVQFFWARPTRKTNKHRGWVLLGFPDRTSTRVAEEDLKN